MRHAINEWNYRKLLDFAVTVSFLWSTNGCDGDRSGEHNGSSSPSGPALKTHLVRDHGASSILSTRDA